MLLITKILSVRAGARSVAGLGQTLDYVPRLCNRLLHNCRDTVMKEALRLGQAVVTIDVDRFPVPNPFIMIIYRQRQCNCQG
jgi:hypothetical protein